MSEQYPAFKPAGNPDIPALSWSEFLHLHDDERRRYVETINHEFGTQGCPHAFRQIFFPDANCKDRSIILMIGKEFRRLGIERGHNDPESSDFDYVLFGDWVEEAVEKAKERTNSIKEDTPSRMTISITGTVGSLNALLKQIQELAPTATLMSMRPTSK